EADDAVARIPARAGLRHEPDEALHAVAEVAEQVRPRRQAVVPRVAEDEEERRAREERPLLLPERQEDTAHVRARMEVERPAGRHVPVLDGYRAEAVDVGEEMDAAEDARRRREEAEEELRRRGDRAGEVAERDEIRAARPARTETWAEGHTAGRHR